SPPPERSWFDALLTIYATLFAVFFASGQGQAAVVQDGPRSASPASRHSTSSRNVAPPENVSITTPDGASVSENSTARRLRTASLCAGSICRHLHAMTRSKRRAARRLRYSQATPCDA